MEGKYPYPTAEELRERQEEEIRTSQLDEIFEKIEEEIEKYPYTREIYFYEDLNTSTIKVLKSLGYTIKHNSQENYETVEYWIISWRE